MFKSVGLPIVVAILVLTGSIQSLPPGSLSLDNLFDKTILGRDRVPTNGPISISESTVGDIINITININGVVESNINAEFINVLIAALNNFGDYRISMADVRNALLNYQSKMAVSKP